MSAVNNISLVGKLTKDIDLRKTKSGESVVQFNLSVSRGKNDKGEYVADFPRCIAYRQSADFMSKYLKKGDLIAITGEVRTGSYDGVNGKVYTTDIMVNQVRPLNQSQNTSMSKSDTTIYVDEEELPFY